MEIISKILENPIYILLFGSGGILIVIITHISQKNKKENEIYINIDVNSEKKETDNDLEKVKDKKCNSEFEPAPIIDRSEEYDFLDFTTEEYYIAFLKTIEEKKKAGDQFEFE